jgi:GAF domain-containing protein
MSADEGTGDSESKIAKLEEDVRTLRLQVEQNFAASCICDALSEVVIIEELAAPASHSQLLEMILETAAGVISARAGALFLVDEAAGDLVCEAAIGGSAEQVKQIRLPLGHGIAGGVALSGLSLAVAEASSDPRWAKDIGERVGYVPESIVCVPLFYEDRVIGSLELLDKEGAPSFTPADLHALSLFAHQAAVTIEQSRTRLHAGALLAAAFGEEGVDGAVGQQLRGFGKLIDQDPTFRSALELARLVRGVARAGDRELHACREILRNFTEYVRAQPR